MCIFGLGLPGVKGAACAKPRVDFFVAYISLILFVVLYLGHKIIYRPAFVKPEEADIDTGRTEFDVVWETQAPTTRWGKFWAWVSG